MHQLAFVTHAQQHYKVAILKVVIIDQSIHRIYQLTSTSHILSIHVTKSIGI